MRLNRKAVYGGICTPYTAPRLANCFVYFLSQHVHVCASQDHLVILDLNRDEYSAIRGGDAAGLQDLVAGWPELPGFDKSGGCYPDFLLGKLLRKGLVTTDPLARKQASPVEVPRPTSTLAAARDPWSTIASRPALPSARVAARFLRSCLTAKIEMRLCSLRWIATRVSNRRGRSIQEAPDVASIEPLVLQFRDLRPLLFTSTQNCLYDSLALLKFLALHDVRPGWVFGVQLMPFAAHCWLQQGDVVFNDRLEHVLRYTPIMVA